MSALRHAFRGLRRAPGFALAAILTLALGIASMGAMFAVVYGVVLAPLPYGEPERLVSLGLRSAEGADLGQPPALQRLYARHARTLDGVAFHRTGSTNVWREGVDEGADSVVGTWVSASMMTVLRAAPLLGRPFTPDEELRGGPEAVILSEAEWRARFAAAPDVVGKTLMVNSVRRRIVGVMPARFAFPTAATRLWLPAKRVDDGSVGDPIYAGIGRLAAGADIDQARRELTDLLPRLASSYPRMPSGAPTADWLHATPPWPRVTALREDMTSSIAPTLWLLAAAAGLVLLVAWSNVGNLVLIRADARDAEFAIRAAIGAGRLRAAVPLLAEAVLLGTAAAALALPLAYGAVRALVAFGPTGIPRLAQLHFGLPALGFLLAIALAGMLVCALVPATHAWRRASCLHMRDGTRTAATGASRLRVRATLATLQIAVALVVTIGSILLLRTAHGLSRVDAGFGPADVIVLRLQLPFARYDEADAVDFYSRLLERVRGLPAVSHAGLASKIPLASGPVYDQTFRGADARERTLPVTVVDDGYFAALGIPMLAGRGYPPPGREHDGDIVISRRAAAVLLGDADATGAVGKTLALASSTVTYTVIGVAGDVRHENLATPPAPMIYRAMSLPRDANAEPPAPRNLALIVRSKAPLETLVPALERVVRRIDPGVPIYNVEAMADVIAASTSRLRLLLVLMAAAAGVTLLLAIVGLYGLLAYLVTLRTREFGIRIALGAGPARMARLIATHGVALTAAGIAAGLALYAVVAPLLRAHLFDVTLADPLTLAASTALLTAAAASASLAPALHAARVSPATALRAA